MNIIKHHLTQNDCYKSATTMKIKGIMIHSVGCNVENPMNFITSWNKAHVYKCVHAFISPYAIYETLPHSYRSWHCGKGAKGSYNDGYISVELTEPKTIRYISGSSFEDKDKEYTTRYVKSCYDIAVDYFANLCEKYNLNPLDKNIVLSHNEAYKLGYATNHGDVEHLWHYVGLNMDEFRQDIKTQMIKNKAIQSIENDDNYADNIRKDYSKSGNNKSFQTSSDKYYTVQIKPKNIDINGKDIVIDTINIDNYNYVKLADLKKSGMDIEYNYKDKKIYIRY